MLSSKFLAVSFLYILYTAGLATAEPQRSPFGGDQFCQSVRTVTVTQTVSVSSSLPVVTGPPGNVNLGNGPTNSGVKNTKTSSIKPNTRTSTVKNVNTRTRNVNTSTKNVNTKTSNVNTRTRNVNTNTRSLNTRTNVNTKTSTIKPNPTKPPVKGTKTSSVRTSSTGLSTTSLPPVSTTGRSPPVSSSSTAAPPANTDPGNPNTSLTLDPSVIQNINGKGQAAGEADSLVSPNNFLGFCVGKTISNGLQVKEGSCNPVPMGDIPSKDNMPSAKFNFPRNFDTLAANTPFTISLQVRNLVTGTFTNAANTYYAAPQQLVNGIIQGHSHVTVQLVSSLDSTEPLNPKVFAFFKGLNAASPNGVLTADVTKGLPAGVYRLSSINSAGNHQEVLGPVAQRGSFNDAVYFTVTEDGTPGRPPASSDTPSTSVVKPTATLSNVSSSSVRSSTVSSRNLSSTSPAVPSSTGRGGNGGNGPKTSSTVSLPVSTSSVKPVVSSTPLPTSTGKKGGKGGDVVSTSTALPEPTTRGGGNGRNSKRMHKRSHRA